MKRYKKICLLLGILAVVCLATIGVMRIEEHKEKIKNTEEVILSVPVDSVSSLSWEYESETFGFHKTEGEISAEEDSTEEELFDEKWLYDTDEAFPVDEEHINRLLEQFEEFGAAFIIEEVEDYGQYGLEEPVCTIHLTTEEQSYDILLGNYSNMDSKRYVSIGDGNVYLVKNDPLDYFDVTISDMIRHDETPSFDMATGIQFAGNENYNITYEEESRATYCAEDVYFTKEGEKTLPLDTTRVEDYLHNISGLNLTDYVTYNATEEELAEFGLDAPELTVTVDYSSEDENGEEISDTFVLSISRSEEDRVAKQEDVEEGANAEDNDKEEEEVNAYVRVGESQIVYKISSESFENLMAASYDSLRHQDVFSADMADIRQIDITLEETVYTITSEKEDDKRTYYYQEEEVEMAGLKSSLKNLSATDFTEEGPTQKEEIRLVVYLDNENFPEVEIELYRYNGDNCLAVVDGEPVSFVQRSGVVDLIEAVYGIVLNE